MKSEYTHILRKYSQIAAFLGKFSPILRHSSRAVAAYGGSKAALTGLTRQLAVELAPTTRVNCVVPRRRSRPCSSSSSRHMRGRAGAPGTSTSQKPHFRPHFASDASCREAACGGWQVKHSLVRCPHARAPRVASINGGQHRRERAALSVGHRPNSLLIGHGELGEQLMAAGLTPPALAHE